jgi:hypothetical protein
MSEIPTSIKNRITKLMALAGNNSNEHEAAAASAKVQALLAEYNLEMSQIIDTDEDAVVDPDAVREKQADVVTTSTDWERRLFGAIAENNFCMGYRKWTADDDVAVFTLIGRKMNVAATLSVYGYLIGAIARLNPYQDKRTKAHRSWQEGCADRLRSRLNEQRWEQERVSRNERAAQAASEGPRGNGSDIILSDVYSSESDLNQEVYYGRAPGTTAREELARQARYAAERAAEEANPRPVYNPYAGMTEAQTRKAKAKDEADAQRRYKRWDREQKARDAKRDQNAYAMGSNAGGQISLDRQIAA